MVWPEVSIEDFPPERDDEPSTLRQDILDELTDHFACALNRELLKNADERLARERVMNQFGDPLKIARQLWFDAMKEKIMSQKIMTGVSVIVAVCSIAVVGIAWMLMKDSQGVNQKMLEQLVVIADRPVTPAESQTDQQILLELKRLKQIQTTGTGPAQEILKQISFQLVTDKNSGLAAGFTGKLMRLSKALDGFTVDATSDVKGKLDFGRLPAGAYVLELKAPWDEIYQKMDLRMIPGRDFSQTIVCPAHQPEPVSVSFDVLRSGELESNEWLFLADFRELRSKKKDEITNYYSSERQFKNENWIYQQPVNQGVYLIGKNGVFLKVPLTPDGKYQNLNPDIKLDQMTIDVPQGRYSLPALYVIRRDNLSRLSDLNENRFCPVIADHSVLIPGISNYFGGGTMYGVDKTIFVHPFVVLEQNRGKISSDSTKRYPLQSFAASSGKNNVWKFNFFDKNYAQVDSKTLNKKTRR